jgi:hypothetical protein
MSTGEIGIWIARLAWLSVGVGGWVAVGGLFDNRDAAWGSIAAVATITAGVWMIVLVGLLVPSVLSLTITRLAAVAAVVLAITVAFADVAVTGRALGVGGAVVFAAAVASADTGGVFVQASAYGEEQRLLLRLPATFMIPLALTIAVWSAAVVGAFVGLINEAWAVAALAGFGAVAMTAFVAPRAHRLSRRWLVVVPTGVVVHDHVVLSETLMLNRPNVLRAGLARTDTEAFDLSGPAAGHLIELQLKEMATVLLPPDRANPKGRAVHVQSLMVAVSRPGNALRALGGRRITIS